MSPHNPSAQYRITLHNYHNISALHRDNNYYLAYEFRRLKLYIIDTLCICYVKFNNLKCHAKLEIL